MRHCEARMVDLLVIIQKDVEVDITRPLVDYLFAAHCIFDVLKLIQERKRLQVCLDLGVMLGLLNTAGLVVED